MEIYCRSKVVIAVLPAFLDQVSPAGVSVNVKVFLMAHPKLLLPLRKENEWKAWNQISRQAEWRGLHVMNKREKNICTFSSNIYTSCTIWDFSFIWCTVRSFQNDNLLFGVMVPWKTFPNSLIMVFLSLSRCWKGLIILFKGPYNIFERCQTVPISQTEECSWEEHLNLVINDGISEDGKSIIHCSITRSQQFWRMCLRHWVPLICLLL